MKLSTRSIRFLAVLATCAMALPLRPAAQQALPLVRPGTAADTMHGQVVPDPFRFLETGDGPDVRTWITAQDQYARAFAAASPRYRSIHQEVRSIAEATVYAPPLRRGPTEFYATFSASGPGAAIEVYVRKTGAHTPGTVLPGLEAYRRSSGETALLYRPSPDGRLVAIGFSASGGSWLTIRVLRVANGSLLPDSIPGFYRPLASLTWSSGSDGLFYDRYPPDSLGGAGAVGRGSVRFHRLGAPGPDDMVLEPPAERNTVVGHGRSAHGRFLVVLATDTDTRANRLWIKDLRAPDSAARPVRLPAEGSYAFAGELDHRLYFLTWAAAPRGRIVALDPRTSRWWEIIPQGPHPISTWPGLGASVRGRRILIAYVKDGGLDLRLFRPDGTSPRPLALPWPGSIWTGFAGDPESHDIFYQLQGLADPGTVYHLDLRSGKSSPYLKPALSYDPDRLVTERRLYPSRDGTMVPIHLVRLASRPLDGTAPLILYGYGFGGWIAAPWFQPAMALWVSRGGVWAVAGVRGGGEFGETWQDAGARRNKEAGIEDYLAAAAWLVANRYAAGDRVVAHASSAGGPLVAASVLRRPDLFRAAIFDYSLFDMLRYDRYSHARHWQSDYGTASNPEDFEVLRRYSPYHTVRAGRCYPAILATPGELDQTAPPFHSYKFVAALQHAGSSCGGPALLRVSWGAGHSAGATVPQAAETWADEMAFLDRVLPGGVPTAAGR